MKYLYIVLGILAVLLLIWIICTLIRRWRVRCIIKIRTDEEKCRDLDNIIMPFGFKYDICQDIFFSTKDAWQRNMGYGRIYDEQAIRLNMIFDCEPLYFEYDRRSYMIELWKGQYGITTGGEIGFYVCDEINRENPEKLFYRSVSDEEMLSMRFTLRKNGRIIMIRDEKHWWVTGFSLGEYSKPNELSMEITIVFQDCRMRNAFYNALLDAGYHKNNICLNGMSVRFCFSKPCTKQPKHCKLRVCWVNRMNRKNCKRYLRVARCYTRTIDRLDYLRMCFPGLYRMICNLSRIPYKKHCDKAGRCRRGRR